MTFLNASLVAGALAAIVPIVLHLMARKEPKRQVFPAVRFLQQRYHSQRTKLKVRRWWLLLLRVLAVATLALALARPTIHRDLSTAWLSVGLIAAIGVALLVMATVAFAKGLGKSTALACTSVGAVLLVGSLAFGGYTLASGKEVRSELAVPLAIAVVVDNGPMSAWQTANVTRSERMKEAAGSLIQRLPATSRIAVIDRSARSAAFAVDRSAALAQLGRIKPLPAPASLTERLAAAATLLQTSDLQDKAIVVLSDLNDVSWSDPPQATIQGVTTTVLDLGDFARPNRTLLAAVTDRTPPPDQNQPIVGRLRSDLPVEADAGGTTTTVELAVYDDDPGKPIFRDGRRVTPELNVVDRVSVRSTPGRTTEFTLTVPPLPPGLHHGMLRLAGQDALRLDDQRYVTWHVRPPVPVLIVGDDPADTDLMTAVATSGGDAATGNAVSEYAVESVTYDDFLSVRLDPYPLVILLDPAAESLRQGDLSAFVASGGRALVTLGPKWGGGGGSVDGFANVRLDFRVPPPGTFFDPVRPNHPVLAPLQLADIQPRWSDHRVFRYHQIETDDQDLMIARYAGTDHPAIVQRKHGEGRWIIVTTPLSAGAKDPWNDLFGFDAWPAFVLTLQMIEYLSDPDTGGFQANVGVPHRLPVGELEPETAEGVDTDENGVPEDAPESVRLQMFAPESRTAIPMDYQPADDSVLIADVPHPGTYWIRSPLGRWGFSANLDPAGLSTDRIDQGRLSEWFGEEGYEVVRSPAAVRLTGTASNVSVSLRSTVLLLALGAFLLEQVLANRFYRSTMQAGDQQRSVSIVAEATAGS